MRGLDKAVADEAAWLMSEGGYPLHEAVQLARQRIGRPPVHAGRVLASRGARPTTGAVRVTLGGMVHALPETTGDRVQASAGAQGAAPKMHEWCTLNLPGYSTMPAHEQFSARRTLSAIARSPELRASLRGRAPVPLAAYPGAGDILRADRYLCATQTGHAQQQWDQRFIAARDFVRANDVITEVTP